MRIVDLLKKQSIDLNASVADKAAAIDHLVDLRAAGGNLTDKELYKQRDLAREQEGSTGIGEGIAIPHVRLDHLRNPILAYGHSPEGLDWDAPDASPVHHVFFLVSATGAEDLHVQILAQIAKAMARPENRARLSDPPSTHELFESLKSILGSPAK